MEEKPFFISQNQSLGVISAADELLHPTANSAIKAESLTETQYFGFCVPEERIHAYCYLWHHPNLKVVSGGLFVWRGHVYTAVHGEICDFRTFMSDAVLADDLKEFRLSNGYGVKVEIPLQRHHVTYSDPLRNSSVDLRYEATSPPIMYGDGRHFEQAVRATGQVVLRGKPYEVDCFSVRDRSWGKPRQEDSLPLPGMSWMQGVFDVDFAFNCNLFDQASSSPELVGTLGLPEDKTLNGGWIYRDGRVGRLVSGKKRIVRLPVSGMPHYIELEIIDEFDRRLRIKGRAICSVTWMPWHNIFAPMALMRWECEKMIAYGDCQEGLWSDYLNLPGRT